MSIDCKYRLYPTEEQRAFLTEQLREAWGLDNCALEERPGAWKTCCISPTCYDQANQQQLEPLRAEGLTGLAYYSCCQEVPTRVSRSRLLQLTE